jgi:hypothetical protein
MMSAVFPSRDHSHLLAISVWLCLGALAAPAMARDTTDWPCVQGKVEQLTSAQMWDGPPVDNLNWPGDPDIEKILPKLVNRRVSSEAAAAAIREFAESQPPENRDARLTLLFSAVLKTSDEDRAAVMSGIERFQQRQKARAAEIERQGIVIKSLREKAASDEAARAELARAEENYNWDVRVFTERQQSMPIACEIPVLIEQRVFELAREIRSQMKDN